MYVNTIRPSAMKVCLSFPRGPDRFFKTQIVSLSYFKIQKCLVERKVRNIANGGAWMAHEEKLALEGSLIEVQRRW